MKIAAYSNNNLQLNGLLSALTVSGNECLFVNNSKPIFDAFYEFKPELMISTKDKSEEIDEACKKFNVQHVSLASDYKPKPAANLAQLVGKQCDYLTSDFAYIMLEDQNENSFRFLEKFVYPNCRKYLKIYGTNVPYVSYIGQISSFSEIANILASSRFVLDYLNNLVLDAWMNGAICIPYRSNPLLFPEELFGRFEEAGELVDKLDQLLDDKNRIKDCKNWILNEGTYFHRAAELMTMIGRMKESNKCLDTLKELKVQFK